ncbi:trypsin-like peptidase domain-containing protein [Roseomonas elaeocarpi]|uniref:Trypsin-like peptidase domain-containing protein n=1 Tax=Roseomonas elaeocarpi TaxID=907779 RepID=A0ABV6JX65_9PROT
MRPALFPVPTPEAASPVRSPRSRRGTAPLLLGAALLLAGTGVAPAQTTPAQPPAAANRDGAAAANVFRIRNNTGSAASGFFAVRTGRTDWGSNLLTEGPLADDGTFVLRTRPETGCRFDLRLLLADGRESIRRDQEICGRPTIAFTTVTAPAAGPAPGAAAAPTPPSAQPNPRAQASSGTGFAVAPGRFLTNFHVIGQCNRVLVRAPDGRSFAATPDKSDPKLDLGLVDVAGLTLPPLAFRTNPVRRGDTVVTYGFPLTGLLSQDPKLTTGVVNGLAGLRNDPDEFQISAPVQPGNSGGPLLDGQGNVVGVVVSKLNAEAVSRRTGDIAQNVNFAVKGERAGAFLEAAGIKPMQATSSGPDRPAADVGEVANRSTVFIRCER